ncbi:LacI family DNA-binding transcriptional regulator [Bacillus sp. FJAT-50079]|uniref:LacI family DNA-binding transcriptional regulator n=1 Tax=Bacillus sp. FJAT-50079 TaxID=2833577 RepID=UPI001BC94327|nr:LacI family DNA-binding transcriptional regulator [Bacillus sp. FJAT-50079]MBS4210021.1 LacI family DNA-binding transcriptional regulator [Bacillus sp. FJAT-50079]
MSKAKRKDVAALAGVSEATVSRVFNNVAPLREETKRKVLEAAKQLNYQPNAIAQSFARGKSGNIGVLVPSLPKVRMFSTYYFSEILSGIGMRLAEMDYGLLLLFYSPHEPIDYVTLFHTQKVDGCIILGSKNVPRDKGAIEQLHELKLPYCLINQRFDGYEFHSIDADHRDGSFQAISHLIKTGHEKIAFLNGPLEFSNSLDRLEGFKTAMQTYDLGWSSEWIFTGNYSRTSGYQAAEKIGQIIAEIDAVFVANDRMAIGLMQGLNEQGFRAGRDYSLIGCDDSDIASMTEPQLSSVRVPLFEMGIKAANAVFQLISNDSSKLTIHEQLPVTFIARNSIMRKEIDK